jgi:hypothetical protein
MGGRLTEARALMTPTIEYLEVEGGGWFATIVDSLPKIQMFPKGQQGTLKAEHQVLQELPGNVSCTKAANPAVAAMCTLGKARLLLFGVGQ